MVYIFFDTKTSGGSVKNEIIFNKELAEKLHKPTIRKFEKRKLHSAFIDDICGTDPADMQLSKFKFRFRFLLCIIDIYSKYAWVFPLKDKKGTAITNAFQKLLDESNLKPIKILVEKGSEFYSRSVKTFLQNNVTKMYSTYNEGKSVIAETFIRTWKNKIYKYMTSVSKKVYIDKLDDIVNKYNNTYSTIKIKPIDVKWSTYIDSSKEINDKDPKFKIGDIVEYQNIKIFLQTFLLQIGLKKFLWLKKLRILCCGHMLLMILMEKKLLELFMRKNFKKQIKKSLELKK